MACTNVASYDESIPSTYQSMYATLDQVLDDYGRSLTSEAHSLGAMHLMERILDHLRVFVLNGLNSTARGRS